jgi:hypothetical protein
MIESGFTDVTTPVVISAFAVTMGGKTCSMAGCFCTCSWPSLLGCAAAATTASKAPAFVGGGPAFLPGTLGVGLVRGGPPSGGVRAICGGATCSTEPGCASLARIPRDDTDTALGGALPPWWLPSPAPRFVLRPTICHEDHTRRSESNTALHRTPRMNDHTADITHHTCCSCASSFCRILGGACIWSHIASVTSCKSSMATTPSFASSWSTAGLTPTSR